MEDPLLLSAYAGRMVCGDLAGSQRNRRAPAPVPGACSCALMRYKNAPKQKNLGMDLPVSRIIPGSKLRMFKLPSASQLPYSEKMGSCSLQIFENFPKYSLIDPELLSPKVGEHLCTISPYYGSARRRSSSSFELSLP